MSSRLQAHVQSVKVLTALNFVPSTCTWNFPNLYSLEVFGNIRIRREIGEFIQRHSSITCLKLIKFMPRLDTVFWDKLALEFQNLRDLTILGFGIREKDIDKFWLLCTRLDRLVIHMYRLTSLGSLSTMEFPRMRQVHVRSDTNTTTSQYLEIIKRCPNLEAISLPKLGWKWKEFIAQFSRALPR